MRVKKVNTSTNATQSPASILRSRSGRKIARRRSRRQRKNLKRKITQNAAFDMTLVASPNANNLYKRRGISSRFNRSQMKTTSTPVAKPLREKRKRGQSRQKKDKNQNQSQSENEELFSQNTLVGVNLSMSTILSESFSNSVTIIEQKDEPETKRPRTESASTTDDVIILPDPLPDIIEIDSAEDDDDESDNEKDEKEKRQVTVVAKEVQSLIKKKDSAQPELFFEDRSHDESVMTIPMYSMISSDTSLALPYDDKKIGKKPRFYETVTKEWVPRSDETKEDGEITASTIAPEDLDQTLLAVPNQDSHQSMSLDDSVVFISEQKPRDGPAEFISIIESDDDLKNSPSKGKKKKKKNKAANQRIEETQYEKRLVILDGNNIAMKHSAGNRDFSAEGLEIAINYFRTLGHEVKAVVPQFRIKLNKSTNQKLMDKLSKQGFILWSPCKNLPSIKCTSYDDRFILQIAEQCDAAIVSNDQYRDLLLENPAWTEIINTRVIGFMWCNDTFLVPKDPYGRAGPMLDEILMTSKPKVKPPSNVIQLTVMPSTSTAH